jgi:hypothetical protein
VNSVTQHGHEFLSHDGPFVFTVSEPANHRVACNVHRLIPIRRWQKEGRLNEECQIGIRSPASGPTSPFRHKNADIASAAHRLRRWNDTSGWMVI